MRFLRVVLASLPLFLATSGWCETREELAAQVKATEAAFAKSMADRDHAAFTSHLSDEAVFFGPNGAIRGKAAVSSEWKPFFDGPAAPFSWEPAEVEVLDSGTLALSSGPVRDPSGKQTATFSSIWRRDADGKWRVIFDKGCGKCD